MGGDETFFLLYLRVGGEGIGERGDMRGREQNLPLCSYSEAVRGALCWVSLSCRGMCAEKGIGGKMCEDGC